MTERKESAPQDNLNQMRSMTGRGPVRPSMIEKAHDPRKALVRLALYLRPYAEVDGHRVWATNEITITIENALPGLDAYEPDDTCAQASQITTNGVPQDHAFHQNGDFDWAWFQAISGATYISFMV